MTRQCRWPVENNTCEGRKQVHWCGTAAPNHTRNLGNRVAQDPASQGGGRTLVFVCAESHHVPCGRLCTVCLPLCCYVCTPTCISLNPLHPQLFPPPLLGFDNSLAISTSLRPLSLSRPSRLHTNRHAAVLEELMSPCFLHGCISHRGIPPSLLVSNDRVFVE